MNLTPKEEQEILNLHEQQQNKKNKKVVEEKDKDVLIVDKETNIIIKMGRQAVTQSRAIEIIKELEKEWGVGFYYFPIVKHGDFKIGRIYK